MGGRVRKPSGRTGPFEVQYDGAASLDLKWNRIPFPETKEEIEACVVQGFLGTAIWQGILSRGVRAAQNPTDDFDFCLDGDGSCRYLELMEVAPLDGPYASAAGSYRPYEMAREIVDNIHKKSERYAGVARCEKISLLLYLTHWAFVPNGTTIALMQYGCSEEPHSFEAIYYYRPSNAHAGMLSEIYPTPKDHWVGFDPTAFTDDVVHNLIPVGVAGDRQAPSVILGTSVAIRRSGR